MSSALGTVVSGMLRRDAHRHERRTAVEAEALRWARRLAYEEGHPNLRVLVDLIDRLQPEQKP